MPSTLAALAVAATAVLPAVSAQFVTAPQNLTLKKGAAGVNVRYKEVPTGICELDPNVKSYSGYADVAEDQHIFWWFFEARNQDPTTAPLTVWINGGPGSSSMIGLFQENGPCGVDIDGNVYSNPYSWNNASNMIFIDQPTQVGFSYSIPVPAYTSEQGNIVVLPNATCPDYAADCGTYSYPNLTLTANSTDNAAPNFWKALQGFMGAFPEYSQNGFHFTTESYGGHYAPVFSEYIEEQNAKNISGAVHIDLQSVLIGNGWFDPLTQYQAYYNFSIYPGNTYDYQPFNDTIAEMWYNNLYGAGNCYDQTAACYASGLNEVCSSADNFCYTEVENLYDIYAGRDEYDFRELTPDPFPYSFYVDYLNTPSVQAAIGAYVNFSESNSAVGTAFGTTGDDDRRMNTVEDVAKLLARNVSVTLYFGDADYNCNWLGGQAVAHMVGAEGFEAAGFADMQTSDGVAHGQVRQAAGFAFVRIYESGHEVPFYQPLASLEMFERALKGVDLATGETAVGPAYLTVGTPTSEYREGNATVQMEVLPTDATYNTTLNAPNPVNGTAGAKRLAKRGKDRLFKPRFH
ncbi:putative carboxypeptidase s1 protein [Neofusicoccum parvum UCRNP2]|uniref:Putative carboxypeptidase s1 protein n=1 Tax=Botryosphaeria parva (strain UCR-NP2) TaxID=1287680 RepID=R1FV38_BOTPV|nr:putative carboxypeptidase s1 protein [Neofusicoccum parvum UCRNP2]